MVSRIDDDGADRLAAEIFDDLAVPLLVDLGEVGSSERHAIVDDGAVEKGRRRGECRFPDCTGAK
jgi:hypothetical protein